MIMNISQPRTTLREHYVGILIILVILFYNYTVTNPVILPINLHACIQPQGLANYYDKHAPSGREEVEDALQTYQTLLIFLER